MRNQRGTQSSAFTNIDNYSFHLKYLAVFPIDLYSEVMKIYLDTCSINRIFDDQSQPRIFLESSAMITIFAMIEIKSFSLVSSEVLRFENSRNPFEERRSFVSSVLAHAKAVDYKSGLAESGATS